MSKMKAIILAGGKGTRMKSELPKVLHKVYDKCIIDYVCDACMEAGIKDQYVIVGHKSELVIDHLKDRNVTCCLQKEQLGKIHSTTISGNDYWNQILIKQHKKEQPTYHTDFNLDTPKEIVIREDSKWSNRIKNFFRRQEQTELDEMFSNTQNTISSNKKKS